MIYQIEWLEKKTTAGGKALIRATLKDEKGETTDNVTIWSGFPRFADLRPGEKVEGDITTKVNGNYTNITLNPPAPVRASNGAYSANKGGIKAAQERKAEMIEKAQDRKTEAILYFNSCNLAIQVLGDYTKSNLLGISDYQEAFKRWRDFFISEFEKYNDPTNKQAF